MDDNGRRQLSRREELVEILRLLHGARIAVEHEAMDAIRLIDPRGEHAVDEGVGDQASGNDDRLGFQPERSLRGDLRAQHIPGRDGRDFLFEPIDDEPALRSFAAARWSEEKNNQGTIVRHRIV